MKLFRNSFIFWLLGFPSVVILVFLTIFGSRILINPGKLDVTPCGDVVLFRDYPMVDWLGVDYPLVSYVTTVTPLTTQTNDGYVCREDNGRGQIYNQDQKRGFGKWKINRYAESCMRDPVGFIVHIQYTAYLFNILPLRPISANATVITRNEGWELCPFRNERNMIQ